MKKQDVVIVMYLVQFHSMREIAMEDVRCLHTMQKDVLDVEI